MVEESISAAQYNARPVTRLLVVDDDRITNRILQAQLKARGYEVDSASDGEQALEQTTRFRPDLLFLDVAMPGIGGLEVLERVKAQEPDLAVIMMTAYGTEEVAIEASDVAPTTTCASPSSRRNSKLYWSERWRGCD